MDKKNVQKFVVGVILAGVILAPLSPLSVRHVAHAQAPAPGSVPESCVGGTCPPNLFTDIKNTLTTIDSFFLQKILKPLAWHAAKMLLQRITASVIDWANSGFEGNPAFVTNPEEFAMDVADRAAGEFIYSNQHLSFLCDSLRLQVRITLALQFRRFGGARCTLTDVIGNVDRFIQGNFLDGGWQGWFELTQRPHNNIYGATLSAQANMRGLMDRRTARNFNLLNWGGGFMSWVECDAGYSRVPGGQECVANTAADPLDEGGGPRGEEKKAGRINSPGKIIETQLSGVLGSGKDALIAADDWNEILGALLQGLLGKLFEAGGRGLRGLTSSGYTGSNRDEDTRFLIDQFQNSDRTSDRDLFYRPDPSTIPPPIGDPLQPPTQDFAYSLAAPSLVEVRPGDSISFTVTKQADTGTQQQTSLSAISSAPASVLVSIVNSACTATCSATVNVSAAADALLRDYSVTFEGSPAAANAPRTTVRVTNTPSTDTTPPTVAIIAPTTGSVHPNNASVTTTATASDNSAVDRVEFSVNGTLAATDATPPYSFSRSYTGPQNYTIQARAFDLAGNSAANSVSISVAPTDTTPPTVVITSPPNNTVGRVPVNRIIIPSATDNVGISRYEMRVNGVLTGTLTAPPLFFPVSLTVPGAYDIEVRAFDFSGNSAAATIRITALP